MKFVFWKSKEILFGKDVQRALIRKSGAKDEVRNEVLFHSPSLPFPLPNLFNFIIKGLIWGTLVIFHFLGKYFIDQGSCFAQTELLLAGVVSNFDRMSSIKKHCYWCLSSVFISGVPSQLWGSWIPLEHVLPGPSSVWLVLAAAQVSLLKWAQLWVPLVWHEEGGQSLVKPVAKFARCWHLLRGGE